MLLLSILCSHSSDVAETTREQVAAPYLPTGTRREEWCRRAKPSWSCNEGKHARPATNSGTVSGTSGRGVAWAHERATIRVSSNKSETLSYSTSFGDRLGRNPYSRITPELRAADFFGTLCRLAYFRRRRLGTAPRTGEHVACQVVIFALTFRANVLRSAVRWVHVLGFLPSGLQLDPPTISIRGVAFRHALELLHRAQIRSPAHSLLNRTWHLRHRRRLAVYRTGCSIDASSGGEALMTDPSRGRTAA